ncbi:hypothetical protein Sme01_45340 [Sphaerisporangium melleum]|uniref:Uncharacterized protein n=1 Tax=Sphaerisporangium melleum TaxID=321316 RepID=A0A917VH15_9ACTN|nr:hypothetical protein [Sphaerisporangium melleum]GGK80331.1 hypothetical protein GCM10007964_23740 [Sphaerisporangium melleum]GII72058.1 hypothetical protein Sme01_45340 [Sphaerisporangium melleum]
MAVTIHELKERYGKHWLVSDAVGGGWYAVRRHGVSRSLLQRGLSNVRCAATLEELAAHLAAETQLEERFLHVDDPLPGPGEVRPSRDRPPQASPGPVGDASECPPPAVAHAAPAHRRL